MVLLTEVGRFDKSTSGVDGEDQTVNLANASLTPKVLWLWTSHSTGGGSDNFAAGARCAYGFSDGTNDACYGFVSSNNAGLADVRSVYRNDSVFSLLDTTAGTAVELDIADVVSFAAGQFVLNWSVLSTNAGGVGYAVVGGDDITNVKVTHHTTGTTGTGAQAYTGVGFQGDFLQLLIPHESAVANAVEQANNLCAMGAAVSSSARWTWGANSEDTPTTMDTYNIKEINRALITMNATTGAQTSLADFTSFDADGFTLNYSDGPTASTALFASLVIKGGLWDVGSGTVPASTGNQTINITAGRDPDLVQMFSWGDTTTSSGGTGEAQNRMSFGAADDSLNEGCSGYHDTDAVATSIAVRVTSSTKTMKVFTANATAASSTIIAECDTVDMDNNGNFVVNWTTVTNGLGYVWFTVSKTAAAVADEGGYGVEVFNLLPALIH